MQKCIIADLNVEIDYKYPRLSKQIVQYYGEFDNKNFSIAVSDERLEELAKDNPHLSYDDCEYILTGSDFYNAIIHLNGMLLHASAVVMDNEAYLFSADSGTGKSTHTELWQSYFGDKAQILNDDKPAIRVLDGKAYAYGTPWSGKSDKNLNLKVPLKAIIFIERAAENSAYPISSKEAIALIMGQTLRPREPQTMVKFLSVLDRVLKTVPVYKLHCNISEDAVKTIYNTIKEDAK